jgi:predicted neuraminidase
MREIALLMLFFATLEGAPPFEFISLSATFQSCHASTLVELGNGDLLSAWFGGSGEGKPDVAIWASRRSNGRWSTPFELVREPEIASYNPVLFHTQDGRLWLYYKFGSHPVSWTAGRLWSDDDGKTWSKVEHLPAGLYGPVRTKPLVMEDGTIVSGTSVESYRSWACWIERSTDNGVTWTKSGPITVPPGIAGPPLTGEKHPGGSASQAGQKGTSEPSAVREDFRTSYFTAAQQFTEGIIQPSIVPLGKNWLRLYARSTARTGRICVADSSDGGVTWTQARPIQLPNPNAGIDAVALQDGRVVLVYNHTESGRTPLNLAVSGDGENFQMFHVLESEPGEFSYPAIIQGRDGDLHITYTWHRKRIRYARVPLALVPE